jgi:hypothetical protein
MNYGNALISADEHVQTSGPEHGDRHSPRPAEGPDSAQKQHAGTLELDAQPSAATSVLPRAQHRRSLPRYVELTSGHLRGIGPRTSNLEGS